MRPFRSLLGLLTGAMFVTFPVAAILLYGITGKLLIGFRGQAKLVDPDEAVTHIRAMADHAREKLHG